MDLNPYLTFDGNCAEAMEFYAEVFGGQIGMLMHVRDSPVAAEMPDGVQDQVMHAQLQVGDRILMASDNVMGSYERPEGVTIRAGFDDVDEAKRVFARLAQDGEVTMEFAPTFWSAGFGMCRDRYGVPWMVDWGPGSEEQS